MSYLSNRMTGSHCKTVEEGVAELAEVGGADS